MNNQERSGAEFERLGEQLVFENIKQGAIYNDEAKRQAAFRWLEDKVAERRKREDDTIWYVRWTFWAAVIAAVLGLVGIAVALVLHKGGAGDGPCATPGRPLVSPRFTGLRGQAIPVGAWLATPPDCGSFKPGAQAN